MPGFEEFQLLRPVEGEDRYFVYTRWATEEAFQAWLGSQQNATTPHGNPHGGDQKPVASGASLLSFEVIEHVTKPA
jgi:heme-degrading monooxygenase HmoA